MVHLLAVSCQHLLCLFSLGNAYNSILFVFAYKHDVWSVNNHLFFVETFFYKDGVRLRGVSWCLVNGFLNAHACLYNGIIVFVVMCRNTEELEDAKLIATLSMKFQPNFLLRTIFLCP